MQFATYLDIIKQNKSLSAQEMEAAMTQIMNGDVDDESLAVFLSELAQRGETAAEISGAAKVLRAKSAAVDAPHDAVDCCGTGGDGASTYNISTAVAFVTAACGVPMAKHGNRSASSKSGAADVLESLGVNLDMHHALQEKALQELNFCFLMAPKHHQAMRHVAPVRKQLGTRTIFNLIGPLANPAGTSLQLVGVYAPQWIVPMTEALRALGTKRAIVAHGHDGLDEITVCDKTTIARLSDDGTISESVITPADFGLPLHNPADLTGGDAAYNAAALRAILAGEKNAYRDIVLANSAAVLSIHRDETDLKALTKTAAEAIDSGAAARILDSYIEMGRTAS